MSITRLQQARQMYAMGKRVAKAFGGVINSDGRRMYGGGSDAGKDGGYGYQGGDTNTAGVAGTGPASSGYDGGNTPSNDSPDNSPNIHTGPTFTAPTTNIVDEVALTGFGTVPGVNYDYVSPDSTFAKNTLLNQQLLNTPYQGINTPFLSLNVLGNTLGKFGYNKNTKFFSENSIGGKINPATGKPFGYGIDGYKAYMEQRMAGNVGAYGNENMGQNAINQRAGDGGGGIMDVYTDNTTDDTTDDTTTDVDFVSRYLQNQPEDIRKEIESRMKNYYTV